MNSVCWTGKGLPAWAVAGLTGALLFAQPGGVAQAATKLKVDLTPRYSSAVAFDVSLAARDLGARSSLRFAGVDPAAEPIDIRPEVGLDIKDQGHEADGALQGSPVVVAKKAAPIPAPLMSFEGISNQDNFNLFGFRVNPPDPVGDVGPNHYVQMVNLAFAVYDKTGNPLLGPADIGSLWAGFAIQDCTDPSGDPIVVYDRSGGSLDP